ncbi:MAG: nucleotidyltransferase domain-containing protein [Elusimicrobia bacterium]|nr:nucleotidyltransferase domain-containing protein [Elusimicrobiota bacterium]
MSIDYDKNNLTRVCEKYHISLLILHGSYAKGVATKQSDIDVGILGKPKVIKEKYLDIIGDFSEIFGDSFDPVFLNGAEALITYYVARDGVPLYEKTKGIFNIFKVSAIARYLDTKKFRLLEKQYIKSIIQEMR